MLVLPFCVFAKFKGCVVCVEQTRCSLFRNQAKRILHVQGICVSMFLLYKKINHRALQINKTVFNTTGKSKTLSSTLNEHTPLQTRRNLKLLGEKYSQLLASNVFSPSVKHSTDFQFSTVFALVL